MANPPATFPAAFPGAAEHPPAAAGAALQPAPQPALHPAVWRAHQLGRLPQATWPSGWPALDAQLPGGGWPAQALTELLLPHPGIGELRLLSPVLGAVQREQRTLMLFGPPARLCPWSWQALGLALQPLVVIDNSADLHATASTATSTTPSSAATSAPPAQFTPAAPGPRLSSAQQLAELLWALEQALASGHAGAVLAWLPARLPPDALRRLQLAAQNHPGPAFLLRDLSVQTQPSPAPLRLRLQPAAADELALQIFKRRGAPLAEPLVVALAPVLAPAAKERATQLEEAARAAAQAAAHGRSGRPPHARPAPASARPGAPLLPLRPARRAAAS